MNNKETLLKLIELEESGEEFETCGGKYRFYNSELMLITESGAYEEKSQLWLNDFLSYGIKKAPWILKEGETYWYVSATYGEFSTFKLNYSGKSQTDRKNIDSHNYYKTRELAEIVFAEILGILENSKHEQEEERNGKI